jgi:hypothetical protein
LPKRGLEPYKKWGPEALTLVSGQGDKCPEVERSSTDENRIFALYCIHFLCKIYNGKRFWELTSKPLARGPEQNCCNAASLYGYTTVIVKQIKLRSTNIAPTARSKLSSKALARFNYDSTCLMSMKSE